MDTVAVAPHWDKGASACNPLLEAALQFIKRGWHVIPLHSPTAHGCSCLKVDCTSAGKHPRTPNGLNGASSHETTIRGWWEQWPDANVGVATGPRSGIFVLDVDGANGQASLRALESLPATLRANTGRVEVHGERTGFHLYFNLPVGTNLRNNAGLLGTGLDIRADGGYVVAAPSLHASGLRYEWVAGGRAILDAPAWLIERIASAVSRAVPALETGFIYKGERDSRLFRLAAKWRRTGANEGEIYGRLRALNSRLCKPPLADGQIEKIARSVASYPPGGPDPLEEAWEKAAAERHTYTWEQFLSLVKHLHNSRPGLPILLPVERIAELMGCDRTLIGRHRKRAIKQGKIEEVDPYIPHQRATRFKVIRCV